MRNILLLFLLTISTISFTQENQKTDSLNQGGKSLVKQKKEPYNLNPMVSSLLSTFIPGSGQIYNRKYWKAPLVWGGGIALYLTYDHYNRRHHFYHQILIYKDRGGASSYIIPYAEKYGSEFTELSATAISELDQANIQARNDAAKNQKQQLIIGASLFYLLQIVDATVDAHFQNFDVSDDISLNISPATFQYLPYAHGISFKLSF